MQRPITVNDQRAAALRFADPRVQALLHVLLLFLLVQRTFTSKDLREHLAPLLGKKPSQLPSRPGEFHPEPLTDSGREPLDSSGSCHRTKAAAFR